ncbi:unnamed protein product, partial [marine sediment metagenome]
IVLLSGSCIPLYSYRDTYKKITSSDRARISYKKDPTKKKEKMYFAHQWVILNRKTATDYARLADRKDVKARTFIKKMRRIYKDNDVIVGNKPVIGLEESDMHCPDEVYPINWFIKLYGKNMDKYIKRQMTTYTRWDMDKDPDHPQTFNIKTVKKYKKSICGRGHIFARKFNKQAAAYIGMNC